MPKVSLTEMAVRNMKAPPNGQVTYWDALVPGFGIRLSSGGGKSFVLLISSGRRKQIGRYPVISLSDARAEAKRLLAEYMLGIVHPPPKTVSFSAALDTYFEIHSTAHHRPNTQRQIKRHLNNHFRRVFGTRHLDSIKAGEVSKIVDGLRATPSEAQHAFRIVRAFFNFCVKRGYLDTSPVARLEASKKENSRDRVLSAAELRHVWHRACEIGYPYGTIVRLLILLGQRSMETASFQWDWIDLRDQTITIPAHVTKNARPHTFPFGVLTKSVVEAIPCAGPLLFPARGHEDKPFQGFGVSKISLDKCGVKNFTHHDLRRTFATSMAALSVPIHVLEKLLNHSSGAIRGVAAIYNRHDYADEMRAAMLAWEKRLYEIIA